MLFVLASFASCNPVATTPTDSAPWPTPKASAQTWPTPGRSWPPTMSPWPTRGPARTEQPITDVPDQPSLSTGAVIAISISSVALIGIIFTVVLIKVKKHKLKRAISLDSVALISDGENRKTM